MQQTSIEYNKEYFNRLYREAFMHKNWKALRSPKVYERDQEHLNFVNGFLSAYASLCLQYCLPQLQHVCHHVHSPKPVVKRSKEGVIIPIDCETLMSRYERHLTAISNLKPSQNINIEEARKNLFHNLHSIRNMLKHFHDRHGEFYAPIEQNCGFHKIFNIFVSGNMIHPPMKKSHSRVNRRSAMAQKALLRH